MKTSILYIFLLSVLYACDSHSLLPPKQQLDQQIAQLNDYSLLSGPLNDQLCEEIETHAQEIGNDSLLLATRQIIYTRYCRLQDTAHARMLLDRMKPYAIRIKDKHLLMNHLRMAFLHAQIRQPAECERWINEARKYAYINPQNWYITAASACLECGLYPQALIYADSALVNLKYKVISSPHLVKAIALSRTGKTAEAEEWTQRCITDIRHFQAKHQIHTISYLQYQLFMEYAVSLRKHGKNKEALSVLEELDRVSFNNVATPLLRNKDNIEEYKVRVARMLSECHYATGNQSEAIQQANRADSLQSHYAQEQMNIRRKMISESLQNELLSTRLKSQKAEAEQARLIQYILTGVIILLMAILTGGYLWWRNHRRRLRQLFDLLISHHAAWLLIHDPLPLISRPQIKLPDHSEANTEVTTKADNLLYQRILSVMKEQKPSLIERRLYARILQIMEDKKPYLDPQFNLCQLANLACTNRTRLSSTLNNQTGMNFSRWLAIYRVEYLIREFSKCLTQEPQELYKTAGFTSRTSFYRQFKEVTGNTPIEYFANLYYNNVNDSTK